MKRIVAAGVLVVLTLSGCTPAPAADEPIHGDYALTRVAPPDGVEVADTIDGEWIAAGAQSADATLTLNDGEWAWNGCHESEGTFDYTPRGRTIVFGGWNGGDMMFCGGDPLGAWFEGAVTAGFIDDELVFFDTLDNEIGRLERL